MNYSREQLAQFRAAFASLTVIGPDWSLPPFPDWTRHTQKLRTPHTIGPGITVNPKNVRMRPGQPMRIKP